MNEREKGRIQEVGAESADVFAAELRGSGAWESCGEGCERSN